MGVVVPTEDNRACEEDLKGCPALHTLFQHGLSERPSVGQISANMQSVQRKNFWKDLPTELGIAFPAPRQQTKPWLYHNPGLVLGEGVCPGIMEGFSIASSTWLTSPMGPWDSAYRFPEA